ncbi:MAG: cytochrome c biogenesis protein CcdA [Acidobacteria bacterium]|nr:cytochrome c biogenesis protein CcdA [Acidobacteriota bacterium]
MGGSLLAGGSVLAAFFAGAVALFSPCCIVFLLPAYLATAVKNRRWTLLPLTLMFALGMAVVLLPITLGVGLLAATLARFHTPFYFVGGVILLALAVLSLLGRSWSMPSFIRAPALQRSDSGGMFALGVFSGVASSCCAPVLAGVMTLSALSSTPIGATALGLSYVFGMVFPLFSLALLWDRFRLGERRLFRAKPVRIRVAGRVLATNTMNVAVAIAFAAMAGVVLFLAINGNTTAAPGMQLAIGRWLTRVFRGVLSSVRPVPEPVIGLALLGVAAAFVFAGLRGLSRAPEDPDSPSCCGEETPSDLSSETPAGRGV